MGFVLLMDREKMAVEWYVLHSKPGTPASKACLHRQLLNTAIAGIVGLVLGVFVVFAAEWWQEGKQGNETV
jgi:uncharacterized protein involved in exopolysaccharide biosynthesis